MTGGDEIPGRDRDWRLRNSLWILPTVVCCGTLTWASFLYVGLRAKRSAWLAAAAFYGVAFAVYFVLVGTAPKVGDGSTRTTGWQSSVGSILLLVVWIGGAVHALIVNREWLSFLAAPQDLPPISWSPASPNAAINPWALDDPWRSSVLRALTTQREIAAAADATRPGPMQDRLRTMASRIDAAMIEVWQVAETGHRLSRARAHIDPIAVAQQLRQLPAPGSSGANPSMANAAKALQAQLDTAKRIDAEVSSAYSGLVMLNARFGEVAARVIELSVRPDALIDAAALGSDVESVATELTSLRVALAEMDGYAAG